MKIRWYTYLTMVAAMVCFSLDVRGDVDWNVAQTFNTGARQLDVALAFNGKYVYVLTDAGEIRIFSSDGTLKDKITVGKGVDGIKATQWEDVLLISNSSEGTVQVITLDFIHTINTTGSPSRGPADADVTIVVFSDFQCPACAGLAPVLDQVVEKYPKKVKVVFKNYPLRTHAYAQAEAAAALAAAKQGKFWEFHDLLFKNYKNINSQKIKEIAHELGLDEQQMQKDMNNAGVLTAITRDMSEAAGAGVQGTPTVFINGKVLRNRSLDGFKAIIERELKNS